MADRLWHDGANVLGNQVGAWLAMRFGGKGIRPLLVVMSLALTIKLLVNPDNPSWKIIPHHLTY